MDEDLDRLATWQWGALTTAQLASHGWSTKRIDGAAARFELVRLRRGIYRTRGSAVTREQAWIAAVLAAGNDAVLSHLSAAANFAFIFLPQPERIDLLTTSRHRLAIDGVAAHRTLWLPASHRTIRHRIPTTTAERTLIDSCGAVSHRALLRVTADLARRRLITTPRLVRTFEEIPVSGRRKSKPMKALLEELIPGYSPGDSNAELDVMDVLRKAGRALPVQQHRVSVERRKYRLDFAYPDRMEALEWQSTAFHGHTAAIHDDSERTRRLQRAGWRVWPLTSAMSKGELLAIVDEIHASGELYNREGAQLTESDVEEAG